MRFFPLHVLIAAACLAGPVMAQDAGSTGEVDVRALFGVDESGEPVGGTPPAADMATDTATDTTTDSGPVQLDPAPAQPSPDANTENATDPDSLDAMEADTPTSLTPSDTAADTAADTTADPTVTPTITPAMDPVPADTAPVSITPVEGGAVMVPGTGATNPDGSLSAEVPATDPAPTPPTTLEPEPDPEPVKTWEGRPIVKMRALDKVTARTMTFEAKVGSVARFGDLFIKVQACREPPAIFTPESAAFLQIWQVPAGEEQSVWVFSGWMFATSPALSAMDHPIYDVWVIDCIDPTAPAPPKADPVSKEAAPAPATTEAPAEAEEAAPAD